jgi:hypothetical protein
MPPVVVEPTISAGERPQTNALDRAATGTGLQKAVCISLPLPPPLVSRSPPNSPGCAGSPEIIVGRYVNLPLRNLVPDTIPEKLMLVHWCPKKPKYVNLEITFIAVYLRSSPSNRSNSGATLKIIAASSKFSPLVTYIPICVRQRINLSSWSSVIRYPKIKVLCYFTFDIKFLSWSLPGLVVVSCSYRTVIFSALHPDTTLSFLWS